LPPLGLYAFDVLLRLLKSRIVVAYVRALEGGMSIVRFFPLLPTFLLTPPSQISIPAASNGWRAGQHLQVRALVGASAFAQAHPLTAVCAPPDTTCFTPPPGLLLAAYACGPWSRTLHAFGRGQLPNALFSGSLPASDEDNALHDTGEDEAEEDVPEEDELKEGLLPDFEKRVRGRGGASGRAVHVILDGPYGGTTHDPGAYGTVLFLAGGSGVTATLGQLDDLVGRCVRRGRARGERTQRVEWVWCVRDPGMY
jgi:hypothetical protein